ncbi:MAG: amidohydrolase family protein [Pseudomonadota bacterium]
MIIDFHTHIFSKEVRENLDKYRKRDPLFRLLFGGERSNMMGGGKKQAIMIGAEELIASMDRSGIDKSVVCGFAWSDLGLCKDGNDYILDVVKRYPDRLIGFTSIQLNGNDKTIKEIERCVRLGLKGIGEIVTEAHRVAIDDEKIIRPIVEAAISLNVPIMLHANETVGHYYVGKAKTELKQYYDFVLSYPDIDIILAHWGGGLLFYELMPEVAKASKRVYYDTAASIFLYSSKVYHIAAQIIGADKILFGTDYPLIDQRRYMDQIENCGLSKYEINKIYAENARKLLRL